MCIRDSAHPEVASIVGDGADGDDVDLEASIIRTGDAYDGRSPTIGLEGPSKQQAGSAVVASMISRMRNARVWNQRHRQSCPCHLERA
eukprot:9367848-Alexandrium_andersonii.AAC.1